MKTIYLLLISILLMSCSENPVNNGNNNNPSETLIISVDSMRSTTSGMLRQVDTTFFNTSQKRFHISFNAFTNDTLTDTAGNYLHYTILHGFFVYDTASTYMPLWQHYRYGKNINENINEYINLNYTNSNDILFFFYIQSVHNPVEIPVIVKNFKLYMVN